MRILLLGTTGLIGRAVLARLTADGHEVVGLARDVATLAPTVPKVRLLACDLSRMTTPEVWFGVLSGIDAVVNAAGQLQDGGGDDVAAVQEQAVIALATACVSRGIRRFVQISAVGAGESAMTPFMRTKAAADARLRALPLDAVILRPGLVIAAEAHGGTALIRALAAMPLAMAAPSNAGAIQTVAVQDVAEAVFLALSGRVPPGVYDLVAPERWILPDILRTYRAWLGLKAAPVVSVPGIIVRLVAAGADALGHLGWRSPFRSTAVAQIRAGVVGDAKTSRAVLGREPSSLTDVLTQHPATVQERWFARLYLLKALAIATLAVFWIASGLVAIVDVNRAATVLTGRGWSWAPAAGVVIGGAVLDIALGLAICVRRWLVPAALGMAALSVVYLTLGTLVAPDLWLDPLGSFIKVVPGLVLALLVIAIAPSR